MLKTVQLIIDVVVKLARDKRVRYPAVKEAHAQYPRKQPLCEQRGNFAFEVKINCIFFRINCESQEIDESILKWLISYSLLDLLI